MRTVVIADDEPVIRMDLSEILTSAGYKVVGEASDGFDAVNLCRNLRPEIVLMDIKMPLLDGMKASKMIHQEDMGCCVVLITAYSDSEFVNQAKDAGVTGYIVKPFCAEKLIPEVEILAAKNEELLALKKSFMKVTEELDGRKFVERAKGKIMQENNLSEQQAYEYLRKVSMDKRCSIIELSKALLIS